VTDVLTGSFRFIVELENDFVAQWLGHLFHKSSST